MSSGVYSVPFPAIPGGPEWKALCPGVTVCEHP